MNSEFPTSEQDVWRYVLGELRADEAAAFKARMERDPALRRLTQTIMAEYEAAEATDRAVLDEPVPERLLRIVRAQKG